MSMHIAIGPCNSPSSLIGARAGSPCAPGGIAALTPPAAGSSSVVGLSERGSLEMSPRNPSSDARPALGWGRTLVSSTVGTAASTTTRAGPCVGRSSGSQEWGSDHDLVGDHHRDDRRQ